MAAVRPSFGRALSELKWLLEGDRWKTVGPGFSDINAFIATIDFSGQKIAAGLRQEIATLLAEKDASQRATARMLGVTPMTVGRDLGVTNVTPTPEKANETGAESEPSVTNVTPPVAAPEPAPKVTDPPEEKPREEPPSEPAAEPKERKGLVARLREDAKELRKENKKPLADLFPMMTEDELSDLAADIKANGLIHPIVTDATGKVVIDGRNRLRACEIAGVEPRFEKIEGDPAAFIVSANLNRRNLTPGQRAMAYALVYPEPAQRGRGKKLTAEKSLDCKDFSAARVSQARAILRHSKPLAEAVLSGSMKFENARQKMEQDRDAASSAEAKYSRLRAAAPDFADLVDDESMTVDEALAAMQQRESTNKVHRETGTSICVGIRISVK